MLDWTFQSSTVAKPNQQASCQTPLSLIPGRSGKWDGGGCLFFKDLLSFRWRHVCFCALSVPELSPLRRSCSDRPLLTETATRLHNRPGIAWLYQYAIIKNWMHKLHLSKRGWEGRRKQPSLRQAFVCVMLNFSCLSPCLIKAELEPSGNEGEEASKCSLRGMGQTPDVLVQEGKTFENSELW